MIFIKYEYYYDYIKKSILVYSNHIMYFCNYFFKLNQTFLFWRFVMKVFFQVQCAFDNRQEFCFQMKD